jgi:hypothetical protein
VQPELTFRTSADRIPARNLRCPIVGLVRTGHLVTGIILGPLTIDLKRGATLVLI